MLKFIFVIVLDLTLPLLHNAMLPLYSPYYCEHTHTQSYEQAFEKIKKATGITDIDQLVSKFIDGQLTSIIDNNYFHVRHDNTSAIDQYGKWGWFNFCTFSKFVGGRTNDSEYLDYI